MRPFRFLATVDDYPGFAELTSLARKAEAIGCSTFVLPDHLIGQYGAMPLLAVVAAASERLRVGTFVLNVCLRHPAVLAQDLATLDVLSGGRLEIGLGAGWNKPEHDAIGIAFEPQIAFVDIGMPRMDGFEVARQLRERLGRRVLLVALTGWGQDEDRRRSQEAGFDHHLTKPPEPEVLDKLIAECTPERGA